MISFLLLLLLLLLLTPGPLMAAPPPLPSNASPEVLSKKMSEESKKSVLKKEEPKQVEIEVPEPERPKAPEVSFLLKSIELEDSTLVPQEKIEPFFEALLNKQVTFSDLEKLEKNIEQVYRERRYLASVYLPPQKIQEGKIVMQVLVYKMGELKIEGAKYSRQWKLRTYWKTPKGGYLNYDRLREDVVFMNENPDREVKAYLEAQPEPGILDVHLKVKDRLPLHGAYSFDNQGAKLTGKLRNGFTLRDNNLLGLDDVFLIGTTYGDDFGGIFLQHLIPINNVGTRFLWGFSHSQVDPHKEFDAFGVNGTAQNYNLALRQKFVTSERSLLDLYLGYDFKEKRTKQLSVTSVWDKLRVLSLGGGFQILDARGLWNIGQNFFFGLPFRGNGYPLNSRGGATTFFKYTALLERSQNLMWGTTALAHFEAQLTPQKLMPEEQFFLGGFDSVRGYADSDYAADEGLLMRLEYQVPMFLFPKDWKLPRETKSLRQSVTLITFFDYGFGILHSPNTDEKATRKLYSVGGGVSLSLYKNISLVFECGVPLGDPGLTESGPVFFHYRLQVGV